jgi:transketolase
VSGWKQQHPDLADEYDACIAGRGLAGWDAKLPSFAAGESMATRAACAKVLNAIADVVPALVGGSADLTENTGTFLEEHGVMARDDPAGRLIHFGVREHGMGASLVGMAMHGGVLPFGGTFFVFSDYMRPSVRLSALSKAKALFVWSHDSVGLGEDGPTHQPIEHLAALRAMPGLRLIRPADANEVAAAWRCHVDGDGPTGLVLTRQALPVLDGTAERAPDGVRRGAYVLVDEPRSDLDLVLIGTGSEVSLCVDAAAQLRDGDGRSVRVVSMPSWDLFEQLDPGEQAAVIPPAVPTLAVEAGASFGWSRWADDVVALDRFGESAPGKTALAELGFTVDNVVARARTLLGA